MNTFENYVLVKSRNLTMLWVGWTLLLCSSVTELVTAHNWKQKYADSEQAVRYWYDQYEEQRGLVGDCNSCEP